MEIKEIIKKSLDTDDTDCIDTSVCYDLYQAFSAGLIDYDNANYYVLNQNSNIDRTLKLSVLMPDTITLTNINPVVSQIDHGIYFDPEKVNENNLRGDCEYEVFCHIPQKELITRCPELFTEGIIQYYPNIAYYFLNDDGSVTLSKKNIVDSPRGILEASATSNTDIFNAAISLDIPYIYDVPISDYGKIALDNLDALQTFRKFFGKTILNIDLNKNNERIDFEYELRKSINELTTSYKKECLKLKRNVTIGTLTTICLSIVAFSDFNELLKCISGISGGAGLTKLLSDIFDFRIEKVKLKGNDCYFLWLFRNKT